MNKRREKEIRWIKIQKRLLVQQRRIYRASQKSFDSQMHILQQKLLQNFEAKLMAVQCATELLHSIKYPSKISPIEKRNVVLNLHLNKKEEDFFNAPQAKPIQVLEYYAKQILVQFALEPQWKALLLPHPNSKFELEKSHYVSVQKILSELQEQPKWVCVIEIQNFEQIKQSKILTKLNTCPEIKKYIKNWLNKEQAVNVKINPDVLEQFMQGIKVGFLNDLLIDVAFYGLEKICQNNNFQVQSKDSKNFNQRLTKVIRCSTSCIVMASEQNCFVEMVREIGVWFQKEMKCLPVKKIYCFSSQGFEFLGFQFISIWQKNKNYKIKIRPSKHSKQRFIQKTRQIIQKNKSASSYTLIRLLSRPVLGWTNYFYFSKCTKDLTQMDFVLFHQIRAWVFRRTSKGLSSRSKLKQKYFPENKDYYFQSKWYRHSWVLNGHSKNKDRQFQTLFLPKLVWITVTRVAITYNF